MRSDRAARLASTSVVLFLLGSSAAFAYATSLPSTGVRNAHTQVAHPLSTGLPPWGRVPSGDSENHITRTLNETITETSVSPSGTSTSTSVISTNSSETTPTGNKTETSTTESGSHSSTQNNNETSATLSQTGESETSSGSSTSSESTPSERQNETGTEVKTVSNSSSASVTQGGTQLGFATVSAGLFSAVALSLLAVAVVIAAVYARRRRVRP